MKAHLEARGVDLSLYHSIYYSDDPFMATFILFNLSGQIDGILRYRPGGDKSIRVSKANIEKLKYLPYLSYRTNMGVFGIDSLNPNRSKLIIVEGVFKASTLHRLGYNALAVLTNCPKPLRNQLYLLSQTYNMFAIGDNDHGGQILVDFIGKGGLSPTDIDEMDDDDIHTMMRKLSNQ